MVRIIKAKISRNPVLILILSIILGLSIVIAPTYQYLQNTSPNTSQTKSITIMYPTSTTRWKVGEIYVIRWTTEGSISLVNIYIMRGESEPYTLHYFYWDKFNDNAYIWTVPEDVELGTDWRVGVGDANGSNASDLSEMFEIYDELEIPEWVMPIIIWVSIIAGNIILALLIRMLVIRNQRSKMRDDSLPYRP